MTDRQKIAVGTLAGLLIAYASTAFVQWESNPAYWSLLARIVCVAFGFVVSLICTAIAHVDGEVA